MHFVVLEHQQRILFDQACDFFNFTLLDTPEELSNFAVLVAPGGKHLVIKDVVRLVWEVHMAHQSECFEQSLDD